VTILNITGHESAEQVAKALHIWAKTPEAPYNLHKVIEELKLFVQQPYTNKDEAVCPTCPPVTTKRGVFYNRLDIIENNYSGLGIDMACCSLCGKAYAITYKIDKVTREPRWDVEIE